MKGKTHKIGIIMNGVTGRMGKNQHLIRSIKAIMAEAGNTYQCTAEDAAYGLFMLEEDIIAQFNSSWTTRVRRDDLLVLQVDGTLGSAVAGLRECYTQHYGNTPRPVWNPDISQPIDFYNGWLKVPPQEEYKNAFRTQWELFLKHVAFNELFPWDRPGNLAVTGIKRF
ncbi:MAG: hypothetical protein KAR19_00570 [Bacteroidales bacterium]|nr:hypothetical protein [Bacteroidales bacterium]